MRLVILAGMLLVTPVHAGDRWPADVCREIDRAEQIWSKAGSREEIAVSRQALLLLQKVHCGVDTQAKLDADDAYLNQLAASRKQTKRKPVNCVALGLGDGDAVTHCD